MINFNDLPSERPANSFAVYVGYAKALITQAEIKTTPNNPQGYLALTMELTDGKGKSCGKLWDNFFDSDKELPRYKLKRLIDATGIQLSGAFTLADLAKVLPRRQLIVDVMEDKKSDRPRATVNVFDHEIYYPLSAWATLTDPNATPFDEEVPSPADEDAPINAADAAPSENY